MERTVRSTIRSGEAGAILLDWLSTRFRYCSPEEWREFIDDGRLTVNGEAARACRILVPGDIVAFLHTLDEEPPVATGYGVSYQDDSYLVIDKPPLLPVHPGGPFFRHTLWYLLRERFGEIHFATRLDRETSGLLLVARTAAAASYLQELHTSGSLVKRYFVVVHGDFAAAMIAAGIEPGNGSYSARGWLVPDTASAIRKKRRFVPARCGVRPSDDVAPGAFGLLPPEGAPSISCGIPAGEYCHTIFTPISHGSVLAQARVGTELACCGTGGDRAHGPAGDYSLVGAELVTGRTHQIRATLSSLGCPVVGDKIYGLDEGFFLRFIADALTAADRERLILPYQALHSTFLAFRPKPGGRELVFDSDPPWFFSPVPASGAGAAGAVPAVSRPCSVPAGNEGVSVSGVPERVSIARKVTVGREGCDQRSPAW